MATARVRTPHCPLHCILTPPHILRHRTEHAIRNRWSRLQSGVSGPPPANSGGAGGVGATGSHEMSIGREMLVPITVPQLPHDAVAEGASAALSHYQAMAAHGDRRHLCYSYC